MRVCLLGRMTNNPVFIGGDGSERYTFNLYRAMRKYEIEIEIPSKNWMKYCSHPYRSLSGLICFDLLSLPIVLKQQHFADIFHATFPQQALSFSLIRKQNLVLTAHHVDDPNDFSGTIRSTLFRNYFQKVFNIAANYSKHIIAVSEQTKQELISIFKLHEDKITVIHSGVEERFQPYRKKRSEVKTIGYLGSLTKRKNVDYIIKVYKVFKKKYPKFKIRLEIYGNGPEYNNLKRLVCSTEDINFRGFASEQKIVDIYNSFDVFIFSSQHEGFGLPILEAERCGIPVLVRKKAKISLEIKQGSIECNNLNEMAEKIYELFTDENLYRKISKKGLDHSTKFTWDKCVKETIKVYEKVVRN